MVIDGYSEELKSNYYSEYRYIDGEINLLQKIGFNSIEKLIFIQKSIIDGQILILCFSM